MANTAAHEASLVQEPDLPPGKAVSSVSIEIDYAIIQHFSEHLYSSPNKAVEELVSNSFDAFAQKAYVYVPGSFTDDRVLVWDDGTSMGVEDLQKLWWIARSPKDVGDRIVSSPDDTRQRALIGKFGIGKLASYSVGHRIAHLCRRADQFLLVALNYDDVPHLDEKKAQPFERPIVSLDPKQARDYVASLFRAQPAGSEPEAMRTLWDKNSWTLAIIDKLRTDISLTEKRLAWVLGNGMPLRPDFKVWVNDLEVKPGRLRNPSVAWSARTPAVQDAIRAAWNEAKAQGEVQGDVALPEPGEDTGVDPQVIMPELGPVKVEIKLFDESLIDKRDRDAPRSYGFFVMVRGRLLNPDDDKLLLSEPSFGTFYRSQFVLHADGLDQDLLADRERLQRQTSRTGELAVLQHALYLAARHELEARDQRSEHEQRSESLLPVTSREFFREPLSALLLRHEDPSKPIDLAQPVIERAALGEAQPVAIADGGSLRVNLNHPLFSLLQRKLGDGKVARAALQVFDVIAVSERLLEGFLYDMGLTDRDVDKIIGWRDGLYRQIANRLDAVSLEVVVREVREASYAGKEGFEKALAVLFRSLGFSATRDGRTGKNDVLVVAPIGREEYRFTIEAKGSKHALKNGDADVGGAAAHRDAVGASHAVIVAREFAGFKSAREEGVALLNECEATGRVSIATVDSLIALFEAVRDYGYPLGLIRNVLEVIESPDDKRKRVQAVEHPTQDFDFRGVLDAIWQMQQNEASGEIVPYRSVWLTGPKRWDVSFEDFELRLIALQTLSGLLVINDDAEHVTLMQSPEVVTERIRQQLEIRQPGP